MESFTVVTHLEDLDLESKYLAHKAKDAASHAYAPYSKFHVGAAELIFLFVEIHLEAVDHLAAARSDHPAQRCHHADPDRLRLRRADPWQADSRRRGQRQPR